MNRVKTTHYPGLLDWDLCFSTFIHLKENIKWEDGIRSKKGFTRKAKAIEIGKDIILDSIIMDALSKISIKENTSKFQINGVYLNYYRNGEDYTPNHTHPGLKQIVISLGADRTLITGKKSVVMSNGDVIVFGNIVHGIPKEECKDGRISIALFVSGGVET